MHVSVAGGELSKEISIQHAGRVVIRDVDGNAVALIYSQGDKILFAAYGDTFFQKTLTQFGISAVE